MTRKRMGIEEATRHRVATKARALFITAVSCVILISTLAATPAHAYKVESSGAPGGVYEGGGFIHCGNNVYSNSAIQVEGVQTWASGATSDSQIVEAQTFIYFWNGKTWVWLTGSRATSFWTSQSNGAVSFSGAQFPAYAGHGYYTISIRVKWYTPSGRLLGTRVITPNATSDFTAYRRWGGNPGFCYI